MTIGRLRFGDRRWEMNASASAGCHCQGYRLEKSTRRRTIASRGLIVPFSFRNRVRCWRAQPCSMASSIAPSGVKVDYPVGQFEMCRTSQTSRLTHISLRCIRCIIVEASSSARNHFGKSQRGGPGVNPDPPRHQALRDVADQAECCIRCNLARN